MPLSRRDFLVRSGVGAAALAALPAAAVRAPAAAAPTSTDGAADPAAFGPVVLGTTDRRYDDLVVGHNSRWVGNPDKVVIVDSADQALAAVQSFVSAGVRFAVRSGGHCYEDWVTSSDVRGVLDLSCMDRVYWDAGRGVHVIEAGALLGDAYTRLHKGWGVTLPGGTCPTVGAGGHIVGGGYGALSRMFGLTVDHLYGVEIVVVDATRTARKIVVTREASDPGRELWWAHTGGGGGNFGVVTKYLLRSPGSDGSDPSAALPRPPSDLLVSSVSWSWSTMTEAGFTRLLRNFSDWCVRNRSSAAYASLFSQLKPTHRSSGTFSMSTQLDAGAPNSSALLDSFLADVNAGTGLTYTVDDRRVIPWLHATTLWPGFTAPDTTTRFKAKSAYLRTRLPDSHLAALWRGMTRSDFTGPASFAMLTTFGGRINEVAADATAVAQRDSAMKIHYITFWANASDDAAHLNWLRTLYADVYSATGGVPESNAVTDGCFVNYADVDLSDSRYNTSASTWYELYYKSGYPRLQRAKAAYDPLNIFRHTQSVEAAS